MFDNLIPLDEFDEERLDSKKYSKEQIRAWQYCTDEDGHDSGDGKVINSVWHDGTKDIYTCRNCGFIIEELNQAVATITKDKEGNTVDEDYY